MQNIEQLITEAESNLKDIFSKYEKICFQKSEKILNAFHNNKLSSSHFAEVTGYGYSDDGRDTLEKIYAEIFGAEDALVRPQIMTGTHALTITFFGLLKHGDTMISISGKPYDSLQTIIGIAGNSENSLIAHGVKYEQIDLIDNDFDTQKIVERLAKNDVKLVEIQRSRGYSSRKSISIAKIEKIISEIRKVNTNVIIMVDNCYCDFVESKEPTEVGADILVGSLMKNLGGGHAKSGGYVVGKKDLVFKVSERLTAPCVGKDMGANFNELLSYFKGLYMAPSAVCASLKTMSLASYLLEKLGYHVDPLWNEHRSDIVQTIDLETKEKMIAFCRACQLGTAVDSHFVPIESEMPGYPHNEIMASGSFTSGATIEFTCDGPVVEPFRLFMQGSLTYEYGKLGLMIALKNFLKD